MIEEEFILPEWVEDKYICISDGDRKNITVGKIYNGGIEEGLEEYLYVIEDDRGNGTMYPIELFKKVSKNREEKLNILLDS